MSLCAGNPGIFAVSSQCGEEDNPAGKELPPLSGSQLNANHHQEIALMQGTLGSLATGLLKICVRYRCDFA